MKRSTHLFVILMAFTPAVRTSGQALVYSWLNVPCDQNLNCDSGCSACNMPTDGSALFMGSGAIWNGVDVCPHPITEADNAVYTSGWPIEADPMVFVGMNAATVQSVQIDSIVIRHRRSADGPQRLRVTYSPDMASVPSVLGETDVTQEFEETVYTDLGCLTLSPNSSIAGLQLRLQGIQGGGGDLQFDEVRIVATPCAAGQVGIPEGLLRTTQNPNGMVVDVLGRPVQERPAPGVYIGGRKRVHIL